MEEDIDKPVKVKGVDTGKEGGTYSSILPKTKSSDVYREAKTSEEAFVQKLGNIAETSSKTTIAGTDFNVDVRARALYTPINLANGIRDPNERAKFLSEHGSKMVKLMGQDEYGIRFNREIKDLSAYKEKLYDKHVDKFLDDLDENQGFLAESANTAAKLVGGTAVAVGGLIPLVYGLGKGLFTWDAKNIFNNGMFDAWETMDQGISNKFAVYGGSEYDLDESGKQKGFFSRFISHPMKSLNADIAPAVSFVASAVITELLAGAAAPFTGGGSVIAANAMLAARATRLFGAGARAGLKVGIKGTNLLLPKGMKAIRGLETLSDFQQAKKLVVLSKKYRETLGTATSMVRSAGYESSLIARDTYESTLESMLSKHAELNVDAEGNAIEPTDAEMALYTQKAEDASEYAWFTNIPLVGFSNMMQFPKIFAGGYKVNKALSKLNPLKASGTVINKEGVRVARSEVLGKWGRTAAVGGAMVKSGITEGFEEFSQGVLEHGLADYYTAKYTKNSRDTSIGLVSAMNTAARNYAGSTEGQDSMSIGFLMGMLGIRLPMRVNKDTGKLEKGWEVYGGAFQARRDVKEKWAKDKINADYLNAHSTQDALKANYNNMARGVTTQEEMDIAENGGDVFTYKNKEHEQMHSFVSTRIQLGLEDTIFQDLDAYEALPLDVFNEQFGTKEVKEFTEESRKEVLDKARQDTKSVIKATKEIDALFNDNTTFVDFLTRRDYKGLQDPSNITQALKEQMIYLHSANSNLEGREAKLGEDVQKLTNGEILPMLFNNIVGRIAGVKKDDGSAEMITSAAELYKAAMQEWQSKDPNGYNFHAKEVGPILKDIVKIKVKRAQLSNLYKVLFTKSGAKNFAQFYELLESHYIDEAHKKILEKIAEDAKTAKTSQKVDKLSKDEKSVSGENPIMDAKTKAELEQADQELSSLFTETIPEDVIKNSDLEGLIPSASANTILEILGTKPAIFDLLKKSLLNKEIILGDTIDEALQNLIMDPKLGFQIVAEYNKIRGLIKANEPAVDVVLNFADSKDSSQPNPGAEKILTLEEELALELGKLQSKFNPGDTVTASAIIGVTHHKEIKNGTLTRDPKTGRFIKRPTDQPVDNALLNSTEFLSNKELEEKLKYAEFKIEKTIPWKDRKGNLVEITDENIRIGVYHEGVFLMDLPAFKEGMPANFLALRKAIIAQETEGTTATIAPTTTTDVKADIEKRTTKIISSEIVEKGNRKGQTRTVTQTNSIEDIEGTIVSVTEYEAKIGDTAVTLGGRTMTIKEFKEEFPLDEDYTEILEGLDDNLNITVRKVKRIPANSRFNSIVDIFSPDLGGKMRISIKKDDTKYDAELAALEQPVITAEDKIIWGHPGLGKTTFRKQNPDKVLDFDIDFKPFIARKLGLPINEQNSTGLNKWREIHGDIEFNKLMRSTWTIAKNMAKKENKMLIVSDMIFLKENASDFNKVITIDNKTFIERAIKRGDDVKNLKKWKTNINTAVSAVDKNKLITTDKYFSDLVSATVTPRRSEIDENFDNIIEQLLKSKVNVFFKEEFKKEC